MKIIRGLGNIGTKHYGAAMTIGKFDGVHLGHQQLLQKITAYAKRHKIPSMVMIFEPSPNDFFTSPMEQKSRLSPLREKYFYMDRAQIDYVFILPFNTSLSHLSATEFIETILIGSLKIGRLWVGDDFRFGFQRQGDYTLLRQYAKRGFFALSTIEPYFVDQLRVSSSTIRQMIRNKQFQQAQRLLGHAFSISGYVVKGKQLGQTIGYPTANLGIGVKHQATLSLLEFGVYLVRVHVSGCKEEGEVVGSYNGIANFGIKPTVAAKSKLSFETHCFGLSASIYGQFLRVEILQFIRAEKKFVSIQALTRQIEEDVQSVSKVLSENVKIDDAIKT